MSEEKRVKCPACQGVAFVRKNRIQDPFLTCPNCGPWNGRGPKFRAWCDSLPAVNEKPGEPVKPEPETVTDTGGEPDNWLERL